MANRELSVRIKADDQISGPLKKISVSADELGTDLEAAGRQGKRGMDELGRSAEQNAQRMERLKAEATAVGAVIGTLASGAIAAGSAYREQARQIDGITRIYGDQSRAILQMTEYIQDFTRYSNDAARESALVASSLATNYDMSAQQIAMLVERSADLAQIYGYSLPDAVQRTSSALRGEGESAEMLGLNLSDAAVAARALDAGITNWNVPGALSEAEKAAFRFQLLMEDTEATVGAAADAADGAGGNFRQFINTMDDGVEAVGRFLGPVGEVAAEMAPIAMALPVVAAGVGRLATSVRSGSLAMTALGVATNPAVLGLGALAAAGVLTWSVFNEGREAAQSLEDALIRLGDVSTNLRLGYRDQEANWVDEMQLDTEYAIALGKTWLEDLDLMWEMAGTKAEEWGISQQDAVYRLQEAYEVTGDHAEEFARAIDVVGAAFANSAVDHAALDAALDDLDTQFRNKEITLDEYADGYIDIANNIDRYRVVQDAATDSTVRATAAIAAMDEQYANTDEVLARLDARYAAYHERIQTFIGDALRLLGMDDPLSQWAMIEQASDAALLANNLTDVGTAADTAFRVIVGNTDAIKDQANAVLDWADALIGVQGEASRLDELVNAGLITGTSGIFGDGSQYAEAQEAYNSIADSVLRIGDNLDAVQAIQAPLMADLIEDQAAYTEELRKMPAEQQLIALAWMDTATAAKAMEISTMAAAVAAGELGVNGEAAFLAMVTGAAQADPVLKALLIDMGLISEGADGTITVNLEGAEAAQSDLDRLNTTLGDLIDLLDDGVLNGSYTIKVATEVEPPVVPPPVGGRHGGYTGGQWDGTSWVPGWTIKPEVEAPEIPVTVWEPDPIVVPVEADTGPATTSLNAFEPEPVTVPVTLSLTGAQRFDEDPSAFGNVSDTFGVPESVTVTINAVDNATPVLEEVNSFVAGMDSKSATVIIWGNEDEAMQSIGAVGHNLAVLDGATAQVNVVGDNSDAMAAIDEVAAYNGDILATSYVDIVTRYSSIGSPTMASGGLVPGYASGGVVVRAGEVGPEVAHFPTGGLATIPFDGMYAMPVGTYIAPNNTLPGGGIPEINVGPIIVQGSVFGIDDLIETTTRAVAPALAEVARNAFREQGVQL